MRRKILNAIRDYGGIIHNLEKGYYDLANENISKLNKKLAEINNQSICSCAINVEQKFEQLRMLKDFLQSIADIESHDHIIFELPETLETRILTLEWFHLEDNIRDERAWIISGLTKEDREYINERSTHKEIDLIAKIFLYNNPLHKELAECIGEIQAKELINKWSTNEHEVRKYIKNQKRVLRDNIYSYKEGNKDLGIRTKIRGFYDILKNLKLYSLDEESLYKDLR